MTAPNRFPSRPTNRPAPTKPASNLGGFSAGRKAAQEAASNQSYYSPEAKERLEREQTMLWLHRADRANGKFGFKWELHLSEGEAPTEEIGIMSLAANNYRDELFGSLDFGQGPIGPLQLCKFVASGGQESWDLIEHAGF